MDRDVIRRAYACSIMLGIRAGGHAVNVDTTALAEEYETVSWRCFAAGKALRAVMADLRIPAPVTLDELAACAAIPDRMCGADPVVIDRDYFETKKLVGEALVTALGELVAEPGLLDLVADFPISELLEDMSWAA